MKHIHFEVKTDGFHGAYWKNKKETNSAIIAMLGDDAEDYMEVMRKMAYEERRKRAYDVSGKEKLQPP